MPPAKDIPMAETAYVLVRLPAIEARDQATKNIPTMLPSELRRMAYYAAAVPEAEAVERMAGEISEGCAHCEDEDTYCTNCENDAKKLLSIIFPDRTNG